MTISTENGHNGSSTSPPPTDATTSSSSSSSKPFSSFSEEVTIRAKVVYDGLRAEYARVVRQELLQQLEKTVEARVEEYAGELRKRALDQARAEALEVLHGLDPSFVRVPSGPLTPTSIIGALDVAINPVGLSRGIQKTDGGWECVKCHRKWGSQRAATMHARRCSAGTPVSVATAPRVIVTTESQVVRSGSSGHQPTHCIAPGCYKKSRGPRFHNLCEEHSASASKRDISKWRKDRRDRARRTRKTSPARRARA